MADDDRKKNARSRTDARKTRKDPLERDDDLDLSADDAPEAPARSARPVAVGPASTDAPAPPPVDEPDDVDDADEPAAPEGDLEWAGTEQPPAPRAPEAIERPLHELGVGVLAAAVAVLTFFPWYTGAGVSASGWSSGTWGPVVFGLSIFAIAVVVLRRVGVAIRFPVHHALILEGTGWVIVGLTLIKRFMAPSLGTFELGVTIWVTVTLFVALGLALLGGSVAQGVTTVVRPGWFGDMAGKLGVGTLAVALVVGAAFGFLNDAAPARFTSGTGGDPVAPQFEDGYPACASNVGVPIPDKVKAVSGTSSGGAGLCIASLESKQGRNKVVRAYRQALKDDGWSITYDSQRSPLDQAQAAVVGQLQAQKGGDCASVTITPPAEGQDVSRITLVIGPPDTLCNLGDKIEQLQRGDG